MTILSKIIRRNLKFKTFLLSILSTYNKITNLFCHDMKYLWLIYNGSEKEKRANETHIGRSGSVFLKKSVFLKV